MSWMDSWSRPGKSQATPTPFYRLPGGESTPYCNSCGRVISTRRLTAGTDSKTEIKYCSSRCRSQKPGKLDRELERVFVMFLSGVQDHTEEEAALGSASTHLRKKPKSKNIKGDQRILVECSRVQDYVFGPRESSLDAQTDEPTRDSNSHFKELIDPCSLSQDPISTWGSQETTHQDGDVLVRMSIRSGTRVRPPRSISEVTGSVGGEKGKSERIAETEIMLEKRKQGQKKARQREMTKCAARRGVVFGFLVDEREGEGGSHERRLCEAVMGGKVVEPSFAKGDWAIRRRE